MVTGSEHIISIPCDSNGNMLKKIEGYLPAEIVPSIINLGQELGVQLKKRYGSKTTIFRVKAAITGTKPTVYPQADDDTTRIWGNATCETCGEIPVSDFLAVLLQGTAQTGVITVANDYTYAEDESDELGEHKLKLTFLLLTNEQDG